MLMVKCDQGSKKKLIPILEKLVVSYQSLLKMAPNSQRFGIDNGGETLPIILPFQLLDAFFGQPRAWRRFRIIHHDFGCCYLICNPFGFIVQIDTEMLVDAIVF